MSREIEFVLKAEDGGDPEYQFSLDEDEFKNREAFSSFYEFVVDMIKTIHRNNESITSVRMLESPVIRDEQV